MVPLLPYRLFPTIKSPILAINFRFFCKWSDTLVSWRMEALSTAVGVTSRLLRSSSCPVNGRRKRTEQLLILRAVSLLTGCVKRVLAWRGPSGHLIRGCEAPSRDHGAV